MGDKWVFENYEGRQEYYKKTVIDKIKQIATDTLNLVDYKTYFKRDNKSIKQEGFKGLQQILDVINEADGNVQ